MSATTTPTFKRAIPVYRSDTGCYEFASTYDESYPSLASEAITIEILEPLAGWGQWTHAVRMDFGIERRTFFAR